MLPKEYKYALVIHFMNRVESKMFGFRLQCLPSVILTLIIDIYLMV